MQRDLGLEKYERLVLAFNKYDVDNDYSSYRDSLFEIFQEIHLRKLIRTMIGLIRSEHRDAFEADIEVFIETHRDN